MFVTRQALLARENTKLPHQLLQKAYLRHLTFRKMSKDKVYTPGWRFRKAYRTALIVIGSYLKLYFYKKLFGNKFYQKRIYNCHVRNANRIKNAFLELKGLFIKVGQLLSILGNFVPPEFQEPLEALQDRIPPRPFEEVQERIVREFGKTPGEIFNSIDTVPLASASIGQAHRATLPDGTKVVVKIQHAHIEVIAQVDLEIIRRLTKLISWIFEIRGLGFMYTQVRKMIEEELDFDREARSMNIIRENLKAEANFEIPKVHLKYCTDRIITTTWHEGVKIANIAQLDAWQINRTEIARRLLHAYARMVLKDGFYHADPHPGNILVKQDGTIVLLDFGAVSTLSSELKEGIPQLIEAAIKNDTEAMVEAFRYMGFLAEGDEAEEMAERMIKTLRNFLHNEIKLEGLDFKNIEIKPFENSLFDLIKEVGITGITGAVQIPKDWVLMNRMMTLLIGICSVLDPKLNPLEVIRPYVKDFVAGESQSFVAFATGLLRRTLTTSLSLPEELHRVLKKIEKNKLVTQTPDIRAAGRLLYEVGQQFIMTIMTIAAATFGYLFHQNGHNTFSHYSFLIAGFFLALLLRALWRGTKIRRKIAK